MGTVLQWDGKRVVIYTDDHDPAHVLGAGSEVVLILDAPEGQLLERHLSWVLFTRGGANQARAAPAPQVAS